jgi:hypothetical protein
MSQLGSPNTTLLTSVGSDRKHQKEQNQVNHSIGRSPPRAPHYLSPRSLNTKILAAAGGAAAVARSCSPSVPRSHRPSLLPSPSHFLALPGSRPAAQPRRSPLIVVTLSALWLARSRPGRHARAAIGRASLSARAMEDEESKPSVLRHRITVGCFLVSSCFALVIQKWKYWADEWWCIF